MPGMLVALARWTHCGPLRTVVGPRAEVLSPRELPTGSEILVAIPVTLRDSFAHIHMSCPTLARKATQNLDD